MDFESLKKNEQIERVTQAEEAMVKAASALHHCLPKAEPITAILLLELLGQARTLQAKIGQLRDAVSCHKTEI